MRIKMLFCKETERIDGKKRIIERKTSLYIQGAGVASLEIKRLSGILIITQEHGFGKIKPIENPNAIGCDITAEHSVKPLIVDHRQGDNFVITSLSDEFKAKIIRRIEVFEK